MKTTRKYAMCCFIRKIVSASQVKLNINNAMYLAFDDGDAATDPRTPPLRDPPPPDAGFRCLAEEDRSEGGSPSPCGRRERTSSISNDTP